MSSGSGRRPEFGGATKLANGSTSSTVSIGDSANNDPQFNEGTTKPDNRFTSTELQSERTKRVNFKSFWEADNEVPAVIIESDEIQRPGKTFDRESIDLTNLNTITSENHHKTRDATIVKHNLTPTIDKKRIRRVSPLIDTTSSRSDEDDDGSGTSSNSSFIVCDEDLSRELLPGKSKYQHKKRTAPGGRTFRGSYRYSRIGIVMAVFKKLFKFLTHRSTLSLIGAFLIHVTLGTIYTLSNINSYLTSYMRQHGTPDATYGGSMWINTCYSVGQGLSMILGGYIEKRYSARLSCILGCTLHSLSIMSTSYAVDYGRLAILLTYGLLPGVGCGLAYMTPMSNGFGWFPNRKGVVAGVILAGFGIGTFVFNVAQTAYVNPNNLSPPPGSGGYFTQEAILTRVPHLFVFMGSIYAAMQFIGCCLLFKPPCPYEISKITDEQPILSENDMTVKRATRTMEFWVLFIIFGLTNQGVLFVNSMLKEYGQIFIGDDMYLAWTGSMSSIANCMGRLVWGFAIDKYSFTICFTCITSIFGTLMFIMPFKFVLSSKIFFLLCTLGLFGSFSGWMSTYPVHLSRIFGTKTSGMIYGLIFTSQAICGIFTALSAPYLIDNYSRFVPFFFVAFLEALGLLIYHIFYPKY